MKIKIVVSLLIFSLLFSFAWLWEQENNREFYMYDESVEIIPLTVQYNGQNKRQRAFRPREYVRIAEF